MGRRSKLPAQDAALVDAAAVGDSEAVGKLLAGGAAVDARDNRAAPNGAWDVTPLMRAARGGHVEVVRLLLAAGADVRARNSDFGEHGAGRTPLHYAALGRHLGAAAELLRAGAEVNAAGTGAIGTPLQDAIEWAPAASLPVRERLAAKKSGPAAFERSRILEFVLFLLAHGADPDPQTGWYPLHCAASNDLDSVIAALLQAGANLNHQNELGHSALVPALGKGRTAAVRRLLDQGLDPNLKDNQGTTHLQWAVMVDNREAVERLLRLGADVDARNDAGETALDLARSRGLSEIVSLLETGERPAS